MYISDHAEFSFEQAQRFSKDTKPKWLAYLVLPSSYQTICQALTQVLEFSDFRKLKHEFHLTTHFNTGKKGRDVESFLDVNKHGLPYVQFRYSFSHRQLFVTSQKIQY